MDRHKRFDTQLQILLAALQASPGKWWSLSELQKATGIKHETSLSAQLRNLRKLEHGAHVVEVRRLNGNEVEYRLGDA